VRIVGHEPCFDVADVERAVGGKREGSHRDPDDNLLRFGSLPRL
jgi:hypothetical protein